MKNLLKLNDEKLFEELYLNSDVVGVEEGIYFAEADITVFFDNGDILEYAAKNGEVIDLDQIVSYYQSHEEEIDKCFFMEQVDAIRECIEINVIESELENKILNYGDYKNGYIDSIYQFIIDDGIFYAACNDEIEGLDIIIDYLEDEKLEGWFIEVDVDNDDYIIDTNGNKYYSDEYIIGGNHGRYLYHDGNFRIEELNITRINLF